jgi:hypothetical protein
VNKPTLRETKKTNDRSFLSTTWSLYEMTLPLMCRFDLGVEIEERKVPPSGWISNEEDGAYCLGDGVRQVTVKAHLAISKQIVRSF